MLSIQSATSAHLKLTSTDWIIVEAGSVGFAAASPAWGGWVEPAVSVVSTSLTYLLAVGSKCDALCRLSTCDALYAAGSLSQTQKLPPHR